MDLVIGVDGAVRFIYSDELAELLGTGKGSTKRASHVEPAEGGWTADMSPVGGPVLGPYPTRKAALTREVQWLRARDIPVPE